MKQTLKKASGIYVIYINNSGDNLTATNFNCDVSTGSINLSMDLSSNLRVQNKQANCYEDARRLVEQHDELKSIQIFEEAVIKGLVAAYEKNSNAICSFELLMGNEGSFKYKATPEFIEGSMFLNVQR